MASGYKRRSRKFENKIAKRADELREKREAERIAEVLREIQDALVPVLLILLNIPRQRR